MSDWNTLLQPLTGLFSASQMQMLLLAWLPVKFGNFIETGIYSVDLFIITALATSVTVGVSALCTSWENIKQYLFTKKEVFSVQVDYYRKGQWGEVINSHYTALASVISGSTHGLNKGEFILSPKPDAENDDEGVGFNVLPQASETCTIEYKKHLYDISFKAQQVNNENDQNSKTKTVSPSIIVTPHDRRNVAWISDFFMGITNAYKGKEKEAVERGRYELNDSNTWFRMLTLHGNLGLTSVALDEDQEHTLKHDLETFIADKDFYAQVGLPYRRGYMFHGKPGTGKTSLVNAIASQLKRSLYYFNLREIKSDSQLQHVFSSIPENSVVVFEDIDAMSKVCHRRDKMQSALAALFEAEMGTGTGTSGPKMPIASGFMSSSAFTLSCLLNCLDGHVMESGNIIIMTTNHPEVLDPALVRAGRIDLSLELQYCTKYQVRRMYENVLQCSADKLDLSWFVEYIVPPCEAMRVMILHRRNKECIPEKLQELVERYKSGAKSAEEIEEYTRMLEMAAREKEKEKAEEKEKKDEEKDEEEDDKKDEEEKDKGENESKEEKENKDIKEIKEEREEEIKNVNKEEKEAENKEEKEVENKEEKEVENKDEESNENEKEEKKKSSLEES